MNEGDLELRERNDCTVIAMSQAFNLTYCKAHEWLKTYGRQDGHGFHISEKLLGHLRGRLMIMPQFNGKTVAYALKHVDPLATYVVLVRGHCFCVRKCRSLDGMDNARKAIIRLFKVIEL